MIWLIAKKELYDNWQSHKITLAFALCFILLTMSVWLGLKDYSARLLSYNLSRNPDILYSGDPLALYLSFDEDGTLSGPNNILGGDVGEIIGIYRPPAELSALVRGLEDRFNRPVQLLGKLGLQSTIDTGNTLERNKLFALFSPPDFLFITKVLLSLLTILFAFDAIAGERERGTLQLMLANTVSRGQLLLGKFLGGYLSITTPFLSAALIVLLLLALSPSISLNGEGWLRLLFLLLTGLWYIGVFFFIGLSISAMARWAATAVLMLLAVWTILVLVLPNVGWLVAKQVVPVRSQQQIDTEKLQKAREIEDEAHRQGIAQIGSAPGYGTIHPEVQPQIRETLKEMDERYTLLKQKQLAFSQIFTRLSPAGSYAHAAAGLAQTGIEDEKRYQLQLKQRASQLHDSAASISSPVMSSAVKLQSPTYIASVSPHVYRNEWKKVLGQALGALKTQFTELLSSTFEKFSLSETLQVIWLDLLLLALWMGLSFGFAIVAMAKCEVRP